MFSWIFLLSARIGNNKINGCQLTSFSFLSVLLEQDQFLSIWPSINDQQTEISIDRFSFHFFNVEAERLSCRYSHRLGRKMMLTFIDRKRHSISPEIRCFPQFFTWKGKTRENRVFRYEFSFDRAPTDEKREILRRSSIDSSRRANKTKRRKTISSKFHFAQHKQEKQDLR